jgi:hypothetical protein
LPETSLLSEWLNNASMKNVGGSA